ncbi:hypothetical protein [Dactylosporangium darangshiense]|uniref:hypothetical protein n=1 Tax=Dactylosporangium darangshiense TaxID=579108 RepID=UPI003640A022
MRTLLMAVACGVGVANAYFPQAISPLLARDLHLSEGAAATAVTAVQLGYAAGIFFLVPLGDRLPRRPSSPGCSGPWPWRCCWRGLRGRWRRCWCSGR